MNLAPMPGAPSGLLRHPAPAALPLESTHLRVEAAGGVARVRLEQRFVNRHTDPLAVTYALPLPADAAISGFAFTVGDRRVEGVVERTRQAREKFEEAIASGHTAALLEQDRSSLFTQEIGNVPPGATVALEIVLDQRLAWAHERADAGAWEWRFPLAAAPRYLGASGRVADAARVSLEVAESLEARATLHLTVSDELAGPPASPSHAVAEDRGRVTLPGGAPLDRDLVVRWPVASQEPVARAIAELSPGRDAAHALVTVVPPRQDTQAAAVPRDLVVLLDTSGSMHGAPLDQARRVASALVDGLEDRDSLELIEFSSAPRRFRPRSIPATRENKRAALAWLARLTASGGTEMREGILEAIRPLRPDAQRQVILVTDGLIGFEREIVEAIASVPAGSRVHTLGVGSSVNRSLTAAAARAGRGVEVILGIGEDPERAVRRLRARTEQPVVVDVSVSGPAVLEVATSKVPDLYAGAPLLISVRVKKEGGELVVSGRTPGGSWVQRLRLVPREGQGAVTALYGREAVEDAEMRLAMTGPDDRGAIDAGIERLGLEYRLATRLTSWIAVQPEATVDPRAPTRRETMPQMLPYGMSIEGLGLRSCIAPPRMGAPLGAPLAAGGPPRAMRVRAALPPPAAPAPSRMAKGEALPPAKSRKGALRTALDTLFGGSAKEATSPALRGRVAARHGREMVIDVEALSEVEWDDAAIAAASVVVTLADGTVLRARVDASRTTRRARLTTGQHARLVVVFPQDAPATATAIAFEPDLGIAIPLA